MVQAGDETLLSNKRWPWQFSHLQNLTQKFLQRMWSGKFKSLITFCVVSLDTSLTEGSVDASTMYEARVDIRKFSRFLQGQFNPTKIICSKLCLGAGVDR